ncbi:MAG: septal ring lytic transglycosylase RlpA family protein [Ignavibacteriaceae bacterium]|nr:septal ring lytic transglycosylase RlpA family protein [Ignavibacteriaceae bacterium]
MIKSLCNWSLLSGQKLSLITVIFGILWTGCASSVRYSSTPPKKQTPVLPKNFNPTQYVDAEVLESVTGKASYYADQFHGKITANGEVFDMYKVSAAHPKYPLETIIRVINLKNQKSVILRINDRMPDFKGRIIDLSYQTAVELDMLKEGVADVTIEVLEWGKGKTVK